jgi:outer membrane lipoprotein-sorting protein
MYSLRTVFAATALTLGLAAPAFAQNISMELSDRQAMMITTSGHVMRMSVGDGGHKWMMKNATQIHAGTIFYMSGGKLYMARNRPVNGQMLAEQLGN